MKTLTQLQAECTALGIGVMAGKRPGKWAYVDALREYHWRKDHPHEPLPEQVMPMLLSDWGDLSSEEAERLEQDNHAWVVQPKLDGVRALVHIEGEQVRIISRYISQVNYRLSEFQQNLPQLCSGLAGLAPTILDGELVCPVAAIDTGSTRTAHPLQATVAILSTSPENARRIQEGQRSQLRFHAFDVLRLQGADTTHLPLYERQALLAKAVLGTDNPYLETVPSFVVGKADLHRRILDGGGEGTVWKEADQIYEPGRRVRHWLKRKRTTEMEAFVTGFKTGTLGHAKLIGALQFSVRNGDGAVIPVAWVSNWTNADRDAMTHREVDGAVQLSVSFQGRRARITGQDESARSRRLRHARIVRWLDSEPPKQSAR